MNKVYIVFKEIEYSGDQFLSIHATEEGAKKECQRLFECRWKTYKTYNPYYWEEQEVQP
jgi:hypothetical protein